MARQFPQARRVLVRNSFHVTAVGDTDDCAQRIVRDFVIARRRPARRPARVPATGAPDPRASARSPHVRLPGRIRGRGRVARTAALTVADLPDRWWNNYSGHGVGLRGGRWPYAGYDRVRFDPRPRLGLVRGRRLRHAVREIAYARISITVELTFECCLGGGRRATGTSVDRGFVAVLTGDLNELARSGSRSRALTYRVACRHQLGDPGRGELGGPAVGRATPPASTADLDVRGAARRSTFRRRRAATRPDRTARRRRGARGPSSPRPHRRPTRRWPPG